MMKVKKASLIIRPAELLWLFEPCVYMWSRSKKPLYVGMSKNGISRITNHHEIKKDRIYDGDTIRIWYFDKVKKAYAFETDLINHYKPKYNKTRNLNAND